MSKRQTRPSSPTATVRSTGLPATAVTSKEVLKRMDDVEADRRSDRQTQPSKPLFNISLEPPITSHDGDRAFTAAECSLSVQPAVLLAVG